jgi:Zn-dependent protease
VIINITLALFNMIPFGIFDGRKVWDWNKPVYLGMVIAALVLLYLLYVDLQLMSPVNQTPF